VIAMANPNWQADFEQALAEEDRSDPTAKNIFWNRDLAKWSVGTGILSVFIGVGCVYVSQNSHALSADDKIWLESFSWLCWISAAVEIPLGLFAMALLRRRKPAPNPFQNGTQRPSGPSIGW